jgi:hypothetical protein
MEEIREAFLHVSENDNEDNICSEARSLATNELGDYEFLVGIIIWYEIIFDINLVNKQLQEKDMLIDVARFHNSIHIENLVFQMLWNQQKK